MLDEIDEIQKTYAGKADTRRSLIEAAEDVEFTADDFIVEEDNVVIVSRDGWLKRQKEVRDLSTTRLREGDAVLAVQPGSTRATIALFTNLGVAYTSRIVDVPASTGYGEPVQKLFKLRDGERVIAAFSLDERVIGHIAARKEGEAPPVHAIAVTSRRLQPEVQRGVVRRTEHSRRPAVRASVAGGGGRRRGTGYRGGSGDRRDARRAGDAVPRGRE